MLIETDKVRGKSGLECLNIVVRDTLGKRKKSYGSFPEQANLFMSIMEVIWPRAKSANPAYQTAILMIVLKLSRLLNGSIDHEDSWHDIAGYATLAEDYAKKVNHDTDA